MACLIVTAILLELFGMAYAILICLRPFKPTYWEVTIGVAATCGGISAVIYGLCQLGASVGWLMAAPWAAFGVTGIPMIVGQRVKIGIYARQAEMEIEGDGDTYKTLACVCECCQREGNSESDADRAESTAH